MVKPQLLETNAVVVGSISAINQQVDVSAEGFSDVIFTFSGNHVGANLSFFQSPDSTDGANGTWAPVSAVNITVSNNPGILFQTGVLSSGTTSMWRVNAAGMNRIKVVATAITSGTLQVICTVTTSESPNNIIVAPPSGNSFQVGGSLTPRLVTAGASLTVTALGANATFTSASQDGGSDISIIPTRVRPSVRHLAGLSHGHLILQESIDNATWLETRRVPVPSDGQYHSFDWPLHLRYYRFLFTNGNVAQSVMALINNAVRGDGNSIDVGSVLTFPLSNTPPGAGVQWTSPTLDLGNNHNWSSFRAAYRSDQPSAASNGLRIEFSDNGTNFWADDNNVGALTGQSWRSIESKIIARYLRAYYLNGATASTSFNCLGTLVSL